MADTDDEDTEVFEIIDYVNATEWERFVAKLEEVIREWKLDNSHAQKILQQKSQSPPKKNVKAKVQDSRDSDQSSLVSAQGGWSNRSLEINFADVIFDLSHYYPLVKKPNVTEDARDSAQFLCDMMELPYDFPARAHCLTRWYGAKEFLVLAPAASSEAITTESKANLLLSSVSVALSNSKCHLPIFIQIQQRFRRFFVGTCIGGGFRTSFEMINLKYGPPQCNHISGLLDMFKSKLNCPTSPVSIAVRFTYILGNENDNNWMENVQLPQLSASTRSPYAALPLSALQDPIRELHLAVTWPNLSEELVVDNEDYSDLDPMNAPLWTLRVRLNDACGTSLHACLTSYIGLCQTSQSTQQIMRSLSKPDNDDELTGDIGLAFAKLTEPRANIAQSISSVVGQAALGLTKSNLELPPIPDDVLNEILQLLFPDSLLEDSYAESLQQTLASEQSQLETDWAKLKKHYRRLKSVPDRSLTSILAMAICHVHCNYGGIQAVAYLWHEFILELRFRLERNILLPRLALGPPNLNFCLIHQKLQMLNYCIVQRRHRDRLVQEEAIAAQKEKRDASSSESDSDDEFYEAVEQQGGEATLRAGSPSGTFLGPIRREGIHKELDIMLLDSKMSLSIPITQEPSPMTEDMLEEQATILSELGTSAEDSRIRAQMQSASLLSDMEAFKAANPGCLLADFVRWYSPNDWVAGPRSEQDVAELRKMSKDKHSPEANTVIETAGNADDNERWEVSEDERLTTEDLETVEAETVEAGCDGHLSLRMCIPGNIWQEVWATARACPVRRQKRLFDDTKEAEKVLHYLSRLLPANVAMQLFPVIVDTAIVHISQAADDAVSVSGRLSQIVRNCTRLSTPCHEDVPFMKEVVRQLHEVELDVWRHLSLHAKLSSDDAMQNEADVAEVSPFVEAVLEQPEVKIVGGSRSGIGKALLLLLTKRQQDCEANQSTPSDTSQPRQHQIKSSKWIFPHANGREYILRTSAARPTPSSRVCPQRMFAVITEDDFRVAGAFTKDTNFQ